MILDSYVDKLKKANIENPWKEVRLLVAEILQSTYTDVLLTQDFNLSADGIARLDGFVERRSYGEPIAKIIGKANFWKLSFYTTSATLDPRPESEGLIEAVLQYYPNKEAPLSLCDLGTGTGCLLLSCLYEYEAMRGLGTDQSEASLQVAQKNAEQLGLQQRARWHQCDWCQGIEERFDIILCNPPYVREDEVLQRDVLFDPPMSLFGGKDGLNAYRSILKQVSRILMPEAKLFLEIGYEQAAMVAAIARDNALRVLKILPDWRAIPRIMICTAE